MFIQDNWIAHHRDEDGELLGYLAPPSDVTNTFRPVTIFGYPMAPPLELADAQQVLDDLGLSYLAERWYLTVDGSGESIAVTIAEISPHQMTVRNADYGYEGNIGDPFILTPADTARLSLSR